MADAAQGYSRKILYIEDDAGLARVVQKQLGRLGYDVSIARDGLSGADKAGAGIFDVVALDHHMPGIDGLETLERIRAKPDAPPVIYVTGSDDGRIAVAALKAGAADYVIKDSSESFVPLLASAIDQAIEQVELRRQKDRADEALKLAKEQAERASRAKGRLLAAAGHDLKQPLLVLSMVLDQIAMTEGERFAPLFRRADRSINMLSRAFDTLQQAARLESGTVTPRREVFPLGPLLDEIAEDWLPSATEKGLALRVVRPRCSVDSDPDMLRTILTNIIGNAIKYTDKGGVVIGCRRRPGSVEIRVIDTGIGIDPDVLPMVFDEFRQVDPGSRGGLGLGLSIVRRTAEALGHELVAYSRQASGSTFGIRVPLAVG